MKPLVSILVVFSMAAIAGCATRHPNGERKGTMLMDSSYHNDKKVTVIRSNTPIRISESTKSWEGSSSRMQADVDAEKKTESKEVQYINRESKIKISEEAPANRK